MWAFGNIVNVSVNVCSIRHFFLYKDIIIFYNLQDFIRIFGVRYFTIFTGRIILISASSPEVNNGEFPGL